MDWASDNAFLGDQEASLTRIFKFKPRASVAIKIVKSNQYRLQIWLLETKEEWSQWLQFNATRNHADCGLIAILASRSGEDACSKHAPSEMTYTEWEEKAQGTIVSLGPRRIQTFTALGEELHSSSPVTKRERRQPSITTLPFTYDAFKEICDKFMVHESFKKALTRSDVPSFSSEKVDMGCAAYVYSCRTSNSWPSDMALSATHDRQRGLTFAVLYGCTTDMERTTLKKLRNIGSMACHPLIMPGIFAELELIRHLGLIEACVVEVERQIFKLDFVSDGTQELGRTEMTKRNTAKRETWLDATYLRNSLVTWNVQLRKMSRHAQELDPLCSKMNLDPRNYGNASPTSSQTMTADDTSGDEDWYKASDESDEYQGKTMDDQVDCDKGESTFLRCEAKKAGKIKVRLDTIHDEYEEKIRDCTMRIDGMAMATQWSHSETAVEMALATNRESRVMKSISLVTMIFLPGTFFATVFSMSFFDWSGNNDQGRVSSYLWIYIVVTAFFTAGTIGMWYFVVIHRRTNYREVDPDNT